MIWLNYVYKYYKCILDLVQTMATAEDEEPAPWVPSMQPSATGGSKCITISMIIISSSISISVIVTVW